MIDDDGLVVAYRLDGKGGGTRLDWQALKAAAPGDELAWVHLDWHSATARSWIFDTSGVDPLIANALLAEETRPRSFSTPDGLFVVLRGVNLNPGADPEDMVSLRMWLQESLIVSVRLRPLMAIADIAERIAEGRGPWTPADFLVAATNRLMERMGPAIHDLAEAVDTLETTLLQDDARDIRRALQDRHQQAVALRRYLAPQREALGRIQMETLPWLDPHHKMEVREASDRAIRYVEDLDEIRERAVILQDELINELSVDMNRKVYVLTVVAAIVLPLGFITGLLGVNVGGILLTETKDGFWIVLALLAVLGLAEVLLFRWLKWI